MYIYIDIKLTYIAAQCIAWLPQKKMMSVERCQEPAEGSMEFLSSTARNSEWYRNLQGGAPVR